MKNVIHHFLLFAMFVAVCLPAAFAQRNTNQYNAEIAWGAEVNTFSGNFFYSQAALTLPSGAMPIDMRISYNSEAREENNGLGLGWNFAQGLSYEKIAGGAIQVNQSDGQQDEYMPSGPTYTPPGKVQTSLSVTGPGDTLRLLDKNGRMVTFADSALKKATSISDRNGNKLGIAYTDSLPSSITDSYGRTANLGWSGGKLRTMWEASSGEKRVWFFSYKGDLLVRVSGPAGEAYEYEYDAENLLRRIINPIGKTMEISYFPNGAVSGAYFGEIGIAKTFSYDYGSGSCTMESVVGGTTQSTTFTYDIAGNLISRTGSCCGGDITYTYDAAGNILKEKDGKGLETDYTYDAAGNLLTQTDPLGNVVTYTYEPVFNQLATVTDPKGNVITYTYDAQGNKIREDWPEGRVLHHGYNVKGQRTYSVSGEGDTTKYAYDTNGKRNRIIYPNGTEESFVFDSRGNKISQTDANGGVANYEYDAQNRLVQLTGPAPFSQVIQWEYDAAGNNTVISEPLGKTTTMTYDALGRLLKINLPEGITHSYEYDAENMIAYTDPKGNQTSYTYDIKNRLASVTDDKGTRIFTYDLNNNLLSETDREGNLMQLLYDSLNQRTAVVNYDLDTTHFSYDDNGNISSKTDFEGNTTTYTYDDLDRLKTTVTALGQTTKFTYNNNSQLISVEDPLGRISRKDYDEIDRVIREINPLGDTTKTTYDPAGNPTQITRPGGGATTYTYDVLGRMISQTLPDGEVATYVYNDLNGLTSATVPGGNVQTYTYDAVGRKISESDQVGAGLRYIYDENNLLKRLITAVDDTIKYGYDELDRLINVIYPLGDSLIRTYDGNGNVLTEKNRNGNLTEYRYDDQSRLTRLINGNSDTTRQTYNKNGQLTSVTDPKGNTTSYTYDANGRLIRTDYADGSHESWVYDAVGNKVKWRTQAGDSIRYTFDALNRIIKRDFATTPDDNYHYNSQGLPDSIWNSNHTITFDYTPGGKITQEKRAGLITSYAYDALTRKRTLTYPGGRIIKEYRDKRKRLDRIEEGTTDLVDMVYDAIDRRIMQTYANGNITSFTYNNNSHLTRLTHNNPAAFWDVEYTNTKEGSLLRSNKLHRTTHSQTFAYDNIMQLTESKTGTLVGTSIPTPLDLDTYSYDDAGNRQSFNDNGSITLYTSNTLNQYASVTGTGAYTPTYDGNGGQTYNGNFYYEFDQMGRLTKVCSDASCTTVISTYTYDSFDRLITCTKAAGTTDFYYDDRRIIEERTGATTKTFVFGNGIDELVNMEIGSTDYYYHLDRLGHTIALTNSLGAVTEQYEYDDFGAPNFYTSGFVSMPGSLVGNPYLFTGRRYFPGSGLYYVRARWYDPNAGRFLSQDPAGFGNEDPRTLHRYVYAASDPLNNTDPSGKNWKAVRKGTQNGKPKYDINDGSGQRVGVYVLGYGAMLVNGNGAIQQTSLNVLQAQAALKGCKILGLVGLRSSVVWGGTPPPPDAPPPVDPKNFKKEETYSIELTGSAISEAVLSGESASSGARVIDECIKFVNEEADDVGGIVGIDPPDFGTLGPLYGQTDAYNDAEGIAEVTVTAIKVAKAVSDVKNVLKAGKNLKNVKLPVRNKILTTTPNGTKIIGVIVDPKAAKDIAVNGGKILGQGAQSGQSIKRELGN